MLNVCTTQHRKHVSYKTTCLTTLKVQKTNGIHVKHNKKKQVEQKLTHSIKVPEACPKRKKKFGKQMYIKRKYFRGYDMLF